MTALETTEADLALDQRLEHVSELVTILARYYRALGLDPERAKKSALADFATDYPEETAALGLEL